MRRSLLEVLGHIVHGRISMESLQIGLMLDLQQGLEPFVFGVNWTKQHLDVLYAAGLAIELAFALLKWLQAPGTPGRLDDALALLDQIRPALAASRNPTIQTSAMAAIPSQGATSQAKAPSTRERMRSG